MTLDGVIQSDPEGDFKYSGWFFGYADDVTGAVIQKRLSEPVDLLLGRKIFDIWEPYWPTHSDFWPNVSLLESGLTVELKVKLDSRRDKVCEAGHFLPPLSRSQKIRAHFSDSYMASRSMPYQFY